MDTTKRQVAKAEFYAALYADRRDIMPSIVSRYDAATGFTSEWRTNNYARELFGISDGAEGGRYWLTQR